MVRLWHCFNHILIITLLFDHSLGIFDGISLDQWFTSRPIPWSFASFSAPRRKNTTKLVVLSSCPRNFRDPPGWYQLFIFSDLKLTNFPTLHRFLWSSHIISAGFLYFYGNHVRNTTAGPRIFASLLCAEKAFSEGLGPGWECGDRWIDG